MPLDDFGGCALELLSMERTSGVGANKRNKAKSGSAVERHDMRVGRILDREAPVVTPQ